jgi:hypothetical protein
MTSDPFRKSGRGNDLRPKGNLFKSRPHDPSPPNGIGCPPHFGGVQQWKQHNMRTEDMSQDQLLILVQEMQAKQARVEALDGVTIKYAEGIAKNGNPWKNITVAGGVLTWAGIKLTPEKWEKIKHISSEIDLAMAEHGHKFDK